MKEINGFVLGIPPLYLVLMPVPFILNFTIKHHANKFPDDNCTDMFKDSHVDNRIKTGNFIDVLLDLFTRDNKRMEKKKKKKILFFLFFSFW